MSGLDRISFFFFSNHAIKASLMEFLKDFLSKGNKGFCTHCSKLAFLIEENADVDSDGVRLF